MSERKIPDAQLADAVRTLEKYARQLSNELTANAPTLGNARALAWGIAELASLLADDLGADPLF